MKYEEFKSVFLDAVGEAGLRRFGFDEELLDLRSMERRFVVVVEPMGGQAVKPFTVTAQIAWRWDAAKTARASTTEEDLLTELLGREGAARVKTERSWLRIDITLAATLPWGAAKPMPSTAVWAKWVRETMGRLTDIEPVVPDEMTREGQDGGMEILAWQGEPEVTAACGATGELKFESIEVAAWQAIDLPRHWDDSEQEPDEHPAEQLAAMFKRLRSALHGFNEAIDHLA